MFSCLASPFRFFGHSPGSMVRSLPYHRWGFFSAIGLMDPSRRLSWRLLQWCSIPDTLIPSYPKEKWWEMSQFFSRITRTKRWISSSHQQPSADISSLCTKLCTKSLKARAIHLAMICDAVSPPGSRTLDDDVFHHGRPTDLSWPIMW